MLRAESFTEFRLRLARLVFECGMRKQARRLFEMDATDGEIVRLAYDAFGAIQGSPDDCALGIVHDMAIDMGGSEAQADALAALAERAK